MGSADNTTAFTEQYNPHNVNNMASSVEYEEDMKIIAEVLTATILFGILCAVIVIIVFEVPFAVIKATVAITMKIKGIVRKVDHLQNTLGAVQFRIDTIQCHVANFQDRVEGLEKGHKSVPVHEPASEQRRDPAHV